MKLPKGLPPLPPVPKGWHGWELLGWGGLKGEALPPIPWTSASVNGWGSIGTSAIAFGYKDRFYIRAIKHANAKSAKKAKAVKARVLYRLRTLYGTKVMLSETSWGDYKDPVFVLPADAASVEAMREQAMRAIINDPMATLGDTVTSVLAAIGITSAKGRK